LQRSESKFATVSTELNAASNRADEINRAIKILETKNMIDEASKKDRDLGHLPELGSKEPA
jgi:hypothetical protein